MDEPGSLELAHRDGECGALDADHLGKELLRHAEWLFLDAIVDLEEPACGALIESMDSIAQDQLRHRDHDDLGVPLKEPDQGAAPHDLLAKGMGRQAISRERHLHDRSDR